MAEGLDAPITQGGTNVSGGQRQRLAIARAVVRRPEIYLFDDSFSALDLATDARLRAALRPVTRDATVVIVAQRVSTIRDADLILVMEGGGMVGQKANDFKPSAKRLVRRMAPEKNKALGVLALAVLSVGLMSLGPRILGRATDIIFAGVLGRQLSGTFPAGTSKEQVVAG